MIRISASKARFLAGLLLCGFCTFAAEEVRIVSLSPAVTETILKLGGAKRLAGRSTACTMPEVKHLPAAGQLGLPFPETVLQLRPTHVITDIHHPAAVWKLLEENGIQTVILPAAHLTDYPANVRRLGKLLQREKEAEKEAGDFERLLREYRPEPGSKRPKVLAVFAVSPVISCGRNSFITELVEYAGGENIAASVPQPYLTLSAEFILRSAPEVILCCTMPQHSGDFFRREPFAILPAVRENRIITALSPDDLCRLGPRLADGLRRLRKEIRR